MTSEEFLKVIDSVRDWHVGKTAKPADLFCAPLYECYCKLRLAEAIDRYVDTLKATTPGNAK